MAGPSERQVRVHRDALSTPWGFRLTGGKDFKLPLTVQRVFVGSPADGVLQRGDVLVAVENHDTSQMLHKEAMDIIKATGGSISFRIRRSAARARTTSPPPSAFSSHHSAPQYIRSRPSDTTALKPAPPIGKYPSKPMTSLSRLGGGGPVYGADYSHSGGGGGGHPPHHGGQGNVGPGMLHRVQQTLDHSMYEPGRDAGYEEDYQPPQVHDLKKAFIEPAPHYQAARGQGHGQGQGHQGRALGASRPFRKPEPDLPNSMLEPGWYPGKPKPAQAHQPQRGMPNRPCPPPINRPGPEGGMPYRQQQEIPHYPDETPAWLGTLGSSGGPKPWETHAQTSLIPGQQRPAAQTQGQHGQRPRQRPAPAQAPVAHHSPASVPVHQPRVQSVHHGPGGRQTIEQHDAATHEGDAKVAHLQYNTPIGLYSRENVQTTLDQQTGGKAGQGTMQVTGTGTGGPPPKAYNPSQSSVCALIAEEEGRKQKPRGYALRQPEQAPPESARYHDHAQGQEMQYDGYQDHSRQSRTMQALEAQMQAEGEGTSDF